MKERDLTMKKMVQVDGTVLGTVGSCTCILKSIAFDCNTTFNNLNVSLHVLIKIQDQDSFSFFGVGNYIIDNPVYSPVGP